METQTVISATLTNNNIDNQIQIPQYIIGESPLQDMVTAVHNELKYGIRPLVAKDNKEGVTDRSMERYVKLLIQEAVKMDILGS